MKTKKLLTGRENEILQLISYGESTNEIAANLCLSPETIKTHRKNIILKVGAKNVANLIRIAFECKLIQSSDIFSNSNLATSFKNVNHLASVA